MKKITRRFFASLFACLLMLTALMPADMSLVFAATSGSCGTNATWSYDTSSKTLTISGTGVTKNYRNTSLGSNEQAPWKEYKSAMTTLVVNEGITELGEYSFYNCTALVNVSLPSTLTKICGSGILKLTDDTELSNVTTFGCFQNCTALERITLPAYLTEIGECAFYMCTSLKEIAFPDYVTTIGDQAFMGCTSLRKVTFGSRLTDIGIKTFANTNMKTVVWNEAITEIPAYAFFKSGFGDVEIPETITSVGLRSFANCYGLTDITINNADMTITGDFCNGSNQSVTIHGHSGSTAETFVTQYGPGTTNNNDYTFESIDECPHTTTHAVVSVEPTCTDAGTEQVICDECGQVVRTNSISALGHEWGEPVETIDKTEENGHIYNSYVCSVCGDIKTDVVHQYAREIDPSSIDPSSTEFTAAQIIQLIANASNYDFSQLSEESIYRWVDGCYDVRVLREADCTTYGGELYTCTVDGCSKRELRPIMPSHTVNKWNKTQQPTCTVDGYRQGTCVECGETVTETLKATGHTYDSETPDRVYDDETDGHTHKVFTCQTCGEETEEYVHNEWKEGYFTPTSTTYDNCELPGFELDTCTVCNAVRTVTIPARGEHDLYETSRTEADCTTAERIYYACHNCQYTKTEYGESLGHDYQPAESTGNKEATCTTNGSQFYKCSRCSSSKTETIKALGHVAVEGTWVVDTEPTCTKTGSGHATCERCEQSYTADIEPLGHDYQQTENDLAYDGKPGHVQIVSQCSRCTSRNTVVEHREWTEGKYEVTVTTPGSCTTGATELRQCTICNTRGLVEVEPPLGHAWQYSGVITSDMISGDVLDQLGGLGITNSAIESRLSELPIETEVNDGIITFKGKVTPDGVVFFCPHCMTTTSKPIAEVKALWTFDLINTEPNRSAPIIHNKGEEDEYAEDTDFSSYLDLNGDGIINGKDWGYIKTLTVLEAQAVEDAENQSEPTD